MGAVRAVEVRAEGSVEAMEAVAKAVAMVGG
jgi:hypothetical protein